MLTSKSRIEKTKRTVRNAFEYAQELSEDERLRADLRAALAHGSKAGARLRNEISRDGIELKLAHDEKLRKHLRAMLDDLDSASDRVRGKRSHRVRTIVLVVLGAVTAAVALPKVRGWVGSQAQAVT